MARWNYRLKSDPNQGGSLEGRDLRKMLDAEILDDRHEFQQVGDAQWISALKALLLLHDAEREASGPSSGADRVAPSPPPPRTPPVAPMTSPSGTVRRSIPPASPGPAAAGPQPRGGVAAVPPGPMGIPRPNVLPRAVAPTQGAPPAVAPSPKSAFENRRPETRRRRRRDEEGEEELDMTPMIDMTFLLLIFFMVSSTLTPASQSELPTASAGRMVPTQDRVELLVGFPDDVVPLADQQGGADIPWEKGAFRFADVADELVPADQLESRLRERFGSGGEGKLVLYADRRLPVRFINQLIRLAKQAGARETTVGVSVPKASAGPAQESNQDE